VTPREALQAVLLLAGLVATLAPYTRVEQVLTRLFPPAVTREDIERVTRATSRPES
jgi:xanthine/uracil permease